MTSSLPESQQLLLGVEALEHLNLLPHGWPFNKKFVTDEELEDDEKLNESVFKVNALPEEQGFTEAELSEAVWHNWGTVKDLPCLHQLPLGIWDTIHQFEDMPLSCKKKKRLWTATQSSPT